VPVDNRSEDRCGSNASVQLSRHVGFTPDFGRMVATHELTLRASCGHCAACQTCQLAKAATNVQQVMKMRITEPTVHRAARVSWVRAVKYAAKCKKRDTT
jgi:hypothetical protein